MRKLLTIIVCTLLTAYVYAEPTINTDPRYCGEPKRNASNRIIRSITERKRFEATYPLPAQFKREEWQVDHVIPLKSGGCDKLFNMQWLPKKIKTCADDMCKDRFERIIYK